MLLACGRLMVWNGQIHFVCVRERFKTFSWGSRKHVAVEHPLSYTPHGSFAHGRSAFTDHCCAVREGCSRSATPFLPPPCSDVRGIRLRGGHTSSTPAAMEPKPPDEWVVLGIAADTLSAGELLAQRLDSIGCGEWSYGCSLEAVSLPAGEPHQVWSGAHPMCRMHVYHEPGSGECAPLMNASCMMHDRMHADC